MGFLDIDNATKSYGAVEVLHKVDISVEEGEFLVLVGPSGCGKSTLLNMIAGLEEITSGEIRIKDAVMNGVHPSKRNIAMVFQSYALYPQMTVAENMGFSLSLERRPKPEIRAKVEEAARTLKLEALLDRKPGQLSGGQRQRVAIGRAIVRNPQVFLLDEPLSNLDAALRTETRVEIGELHQRLKTTMIYVTHDQVEAMTMADRIVILNAGRIEQVGTPMELYNTPATEFVASFIGSPKMNLISGPAAAEYQAATIGIRPEHFDIVTEAPHWQGQITLVERLGHNTIVYARVPDVGPVTISLEGQHDYEVGQQVGLNADLSKVHRFDSAGRPVV